MGDRKRLLQRAGRVARAGDGKQIRLRERLTTPFEDDSAALVGDETLRAAPPKRMALQPNETGSFLQCPADMRPVTDLVNLRLMKRPG